MDGKVVIGTELETKSFDAQITMLERKLNDLEATANDTDIAPKEGTNEYIKLQTEIEKTRNQLNGLYKQQEKYNDSVKKAQLVGFEKIKSSVDNVGNSVEKVTKKVGRWALAIFGVRSAYMLVRSAMNVIANDDKQLKADIDYIKSALAYTLEPLIRGIVEMVKNLMFYIGYIVKMWTGKNIFENANKSLGNANKKAKELKKTLAGFDEMNIVNDSSGEQDVMPSFNLAQGLDEQQVPSWLQWIVDHKDEVIEGLTGIAGGLIALKLGFSPLQALGIGITIAGVTESIQGLLEYIKDPSWENFGQTIEGAGKSMIGLGVATNNWGLVGVGAAVTLYGTILRHWEDIKEVLGNGIDWLAGKSDWIHEYLGDSIGNVYDTIVETLGNTLTYFDDEFKAIKKMFTGWIDFIVGIFTGDWDRALSGIKNIFTSILDQIVAKVKFVINILKSILTLAWNGLKSALGILKAVLLAPINLVIDGLNAVIGGLNKINFTVPDWIPVFGGRSWGFDIPKIPKLARGGIVNNPGPGVMMGNYIAGEKGAEAVLPLTDDTLQKLANMIPITVNLTNTMNGRVISRELKKIQNENGFAYNR